MKTISIIVAAYNMEDYLGRCLDSVVDHKWDDSVEVIVVNDGSKDKTLQIARQYQNEYPKIVTVIDKENGHYGSCINAALPVAKGKYVKTLDADDWFDTDAFGYLIDKLQTLDSDLVITNFSKQYISGETKFVRFCSQDYTIRHDTPPPPSSVISCKSDNYIFHRCSVGHNTSTPFPIFPLLAMHAVTYRTDLLRRMNYRQSEGIAYTDVEWVFFPIFFVETISFINADVYQYFLGREGQTVESHTFHKNVAHRCASMRRMLSYYWLNKDILSESKERYLLYWMKRGVVGLYKSWLMWQSDTDFSPEEVKSFEYFMRKNDEDFYTDFSEEKIHKYLPFKYIHYWRKNANRSPSYLRRLMKMKIQIGMFLNRKSLLS